MQNIATQTTAAPIIEFDAAKTPTIKIDSIKASVKIKTDTEHSSITPKIDYSPVLSVERACLDDANMVKQDRAFYVNAFKRGVEKTARATLEMCRVVYEARQALDNYQFENFCKEVGYRDGSSTIRKFIAIGKVYPRFIDLADQLPCAWTTLYQITQISADEFDAYLKNGKRLDELKGKRLAELTQKTVDASDVTKSLVYDSEFGGHAVAKMFTTKKIDDKDWRAIEKALNEMSARLPVRFVVPKAFLEMIEEARLRRYEQTKKHYKGQAFRPDTWDMGEEANAVLPREEPEVIEQN
jgi:hypothetical protein